MKQLINDIISSMVNRCENNIYRPPLLGFAKADDEIFFRFKSLIGENHLMPDELLAGARSVMAFFLPYNNELIVENRQGALAARSWALAYHFTNNFIDGICREVSQCLGEKGIKTAWLLPTYEFDKNKLVAQWSHKHVAFACGLGTFGKNQLLITSKGCAGRFGTMVIDIDIEPTPKSSHTHHCFAESGCSYCRTNCPVEALNNGEFDRHKCYGQCLANDNLHKDLGCVEVCGKCATGPCAYID